MLLEGKRILITGVLTHRSIAFAVAENAQRQGAEVLLTAWGKARRVTERAAKRLPDPVDILELDAGSDEDFEQLSKVLWDEYRTVHGVLHGIGFAPQSCITGQFVDAPWDDVATTLRLSAFSLNALARAVLPVMREEGGSIVALDFDSTRAWPQYDWMGVAKSALESSARYLARTLGPVGVRVNLVCAGPLLTVSARAIEGFSQIDEIWRARAPLGWDARNTQAVGRACAALLSDWFPMTTGEMIHVDGGYHAVGV